MADRGDGSIRLGRVDTAGQEDAARWERLAELCCLEVPPPHRPEPGQPVYEVRAGDRVAQIAEQQLLGPVRELVTTVLSESAG